MPNINAKAYFKAPPQDKLCFSKSIYSVTVSVGQKTQEKEKLAATLKIINNSFKESVIMVCDSLQRHSLAINNSSNE